jgi:hypothetical protein
MTLQIRENFDSEFLVIASVFVLIGAAGIALFNGPLTPSQDGCYCIIPTPEPGAAQGTSSILLVIGLLFLPIGILKGGPPSFGRRMPVPPKQVSPTPVQLPAGRAYTPLGIRSGNLYTLGVAGIIIGVDFLAIPGFLLLNNVLVTGAGVALSVLGAVATYFGSRKPT